MLSKSLPHFHDVTSSYEGLTRTLLRKEPPMKISLSINHKGYVRQLVKFAALALLTTPVFAETYTITDLGTLGTNSNGSYSIAYCINNSGQVAGESSAPSHQMSDPAFLYSNGQLINIGTLGGEYGQPRGINTSGQIAGYSTLATGSYRAFIYTGGQMTDIGTLGADYSVAYALNDSGQVVGNSAHLGGQDHAFFYSNGEMTDLGTLGGDTSNAYGINNLGIIVGYSYNSSGDFLGFIYQNGNMTPLGPSAAAGASPTQSTTITRSPVRLTPGATVPRTRSASATGKWLTWARSADRALGASRSTIAAP